MYDITTRCPLQYKDWSLRYKILFAAVVPFLIAVVLTLPIFANNAIKGMEEKAKAYADELTYGLSLGVQLHLDKTLSEGQVLAEALSIMVDNQVFDYDSAEKILRSALEKNKNFSHMWAVLDATSYHVKSGSDTSGLFDPTTSKFSPVFYRDSQTGLILTDQIGSMKYSQERINSDLVQKNKNVLLLAQERGGKSSAHIIQPMFNKDNQYIGALGLEVDLSKVQDLLIDLGNYGVASSTLLSSDNQKIMQFTNDANAAGSVEDAHVGEHIKRALTSNKEYTEDYIDKKSGRKIYELVFPIKFQGSQDVWMAQIIYPLDKGTQEVYQNILFVLFIVGVCLTIGISVSTVTAKNISSPITQISTALEKISAGDYEVEIPEVNSHDEVGHMALSAQVFKQNAKELVMARQQAESANVAKTEFLANMSHELRTPMHAMLSYAKLGLDRTEDHESKAFKYFNNITTSGERLLKLLNDLLDLSKLEAGKVEFHFKKADLYHTIDSVIMELKSLISEKKLNIITQKVLENGTISCDQEKMSQVLINLLSNAIKFSPEGGNIYISVASNNREHGINNGVEIKVEDEGIGIPESELEQVFDKFVQSSKSNKGTGGTGLGLSIAKSIVSAHKGKIWAKTRVPTGATFIVVLPMDQKNEFEEVTEDA